MLALTAACSLPDAPPPVAAPVTGAQLAETVYLAQSGPDREDAVFHVPGTADGETRIALAATAPRPIAARLSCAGPARLRAPGEVGPGLFLRPGATRAVTVPPAGAGRRPELVLPGETGACTLTWGEGHRIALRRDAEHIPANGPPRRCPAPATPPTDPLAQVFFAARPLDMTCAGPSGPVELVAGELDALKWRVDRLTGGDVSPAALRAGDPDLALDFSNAPRLDEIVLSYLSIRADLSGWLTIRTLAFHAARGTRIRIITAAALMPEFDRRLLKALAAQYPNVSLQFFRYPVRAPGGLIDNLQRTNHTKVFLGLSPEPGRSFALIGGRNVADGYFLEDVVNHPDHPFLRAYDEDGGEIGVVFHSRYDDFELALTNRARVAEIARQFDRFYRRDSRTQAMPPAVAPSAPAPAAGDGLVRHFISLPWADGRAHEAFYVDLFDAARSEIFVVSPFNYPTPAIEAALLRAAARGVDVRFVTRRGGDEPPAMFTRAMNAAFDDETRGRIRFRLYDTGEWLLHAKIVVIDNRLGVVASTNLNRRSYYHDTENGLVFLDRAVAGALRAEATRLWAMGGIEDDTEEYRLINALFKALPWLEQYL